MYPPGVVIPPPHNRKMNPYQVPPAVGSPPPHDLKSTPTPEARNNNNMDTSKRHKSDKKLNLWCTFLYQFFDVFNDNPTTPIPLLKMACAIFFIY